MVYIQRVKFLRSFIKILNTKQCFSLSSTEIFSCKLSLKYDDIYSKAVVFNLFKICVHQTTEL